MARPKNSQTVFGLRRFGLGVRPGDLKTIGRDVRGAIRAELKTEDCSLAAPLLPATLLYQQKLDWERYKLSLERATPEQMAALKPGGKMAVEQPEVPRHHEEMVARIEGVSRPLVGVNERLVWFWANHFAVSGAKNGWVSVTSGAFEREAIRPHVFGRFEDMLLATARHYAMLAYLDNSLSIGPTSDEGRRTKRGLNENYAREVLELHTLGVNGGYTQADVTALAAVLTGWQVGEGTAVFTFNDKAHEPGPKTVLNVAYTQDGEGQGEAALRALARHPSTARFISTKLARHFIDDVPPPKLVARLEKVFLKSQGHLPTVYKSLIESREAWQAFGRKLRTPQEFLFATTRATGYRPKGPETLRALRALGQMAWSPPGPNGYSDLTNDWATSTGVKARIDVAFDIASRLDPNLKPVDLARSLYGDAVSPETLAAVSAAPTARDGMTLFLISPEVQRR